MQGSRVNGLWFRACSECGGSFPVLMSTALAIDRGDYWLICADHKEAA